MTRRPASTPWAGNCSRRTRARAANSEWRAAAYLPGAVQRSNAKRRRFVRRCFCQSLDMSPMRAPVLLTVRPMLRHGPARDRRHSHGRTTKPLREEIQPCGVAASGPAAPGIVRERQDLSTRHVVFVLDGNIRNLAFGPIQYGKQRLIAAINILAKFDLALIIDESGLVG